MNEEKISNLNFQRTAYILAIGSKCQVKLVAENLANTAKKYNFINLDDSDLIHEP